MQENLYVGDPREEEGENPREEAKGDPGEDARVGPDVAGGGGRAGDDPRGGLGEKAVVIESEFNFCRSGRGLLFGFDSGREGLLGSACFHACL